MMSHQSSLEKPLESYRDEFPVTDKYIYLDHAGIAPVSNRVKRAVEDFLKDVAEAGALNYGSWMERVNRIRERCGELVGADAEEIAFVKNTSHGLSVIAEGLDWREGDNLIICEKEFPSNVYPWLNLGRKGVEIREVPSRGGRILIRDIERLIDTGTRLLTISSVQFANGFRVDLKRVGELCREKGVLLCVDAIQSLGVIPMSVKEFHVDFLAADGHKWLLAPEGTGIFYCRKELAEKINPPLIGWKSIQNESDYDRVDFRLKTDALRFEEGSLSVMGIFALGAAVELLLEAGISRIEKRVLDLGDLIIGEAEKRKFNIKSPKDREERGGIVSVLRDFNPLWIKDKLKEQGIMANVRGGAVRISPHFYNTEDEILRFFEAMDGLM
ncbi:MAG TPA: aminotransferase class V-fold PLP-dependent enzyme [Thermodesulfobacteriota bacterium]|nr:aminotransferase class V-fold PLP-dependent enzyme [Thermodesulfobacteriota bacterium]